MTNPSDQKAESCCPVENTGSACCQPAGQAPCKKSKTLIGVTIIMAAVAVGAYSLAPRTSAESDKTSMAKSFSASLNDESSVPKDGANKAESVPKREEISLIPLESLQSLDTLAADKNVVFIVLPGETQVPSRTVPKQVETVVNNLANSGQKIGVFTLDSSASDHNKLVRHFSVERFPCVVILGRQGSAQAVAGDITEGRLYNAFVLASKPGACCPATSNAACCSK